MLLPYFFLFFFLLPIAQTVDVSHLQLLKKQRSWRFMFPEMTLSWIFTFQDTREVLSFMSYVPISKFYEDLNSILSDEDLCPTIVRRWELEILRHSAENFRTCTWFLMLSLLTILIWTKERLYRVGDTQELSMTLLVSVLDSSGEIGPGIMKGHDTFHGLYDECAGIKVGISGRDRPFKGAVSSSECPSCFRSERLPCRISHSLLACPTRRSAPTPWSTACRCCCGWKTDGGFLIANRSFAEACGLAHADGAEMGMEHHLGLTCDPIAGLCKSPASSARAACCRTRQHCYLRAVIRWPASCFVW